MSDDGQLPDTNTGTDTSTDTNGISLEIHHVNVTNGDGSIIMVKQGDTVLKSVLIDITGLNQGPRQMQAYWSQYGIGDTFDYMAVSHYHEDHMTGILKAQPKFKKYIDVGGYWQSKDEVKAINPSYESSAAFKKYQEYIRALSDTNGKSTPPGSDYATREAIPFIDDANYTNGVCDNPELLKPHKIVLHESGAGEISLFCFAADGILADGTNVMKQQSEQKQANAKTEPAKSVSSPNNYSLAFILAWPEQDFYYYTAGDLSGDPTLQHYLNIEQPLVDYLKNGYLKDKPLSAMKADHHGSSYNTYGSYENDKGEDIPGFLDRLEPTTIIVPTNLKLGAPGDEFFSRVKTWGENKNKNTSEEKGKACVYFVNECAYSDGMKFRGAQYSSVEQLVNTESLPTNLVYFFEGAGRGESGNPIMNTWREKNEGNQDNTPCAVCIRVPSIYNSNQLPTSSDETGGNSGKAVPASAITCKVIPKNNHDVWILTGSYTLPEGGNSSSRSKPLYYFPKTFSVISSENATYDVHMDGIINDEANYIWMGREQQNNMDLVKINLPKIGAWQDAYINENKLNKEINGDFIHSLKAVIWQQLGNLYTYEFKPGPGRECFQYTLRPERLNMMGPLEHQTVFNFIFRSQSPKKNFITLGENIDKLQSVKIYNKPPPNPLAPPAPPAPPERRETGRKRKQVSRYDPDPYPKKSKFNNSN